MQQVYNRGVGIPAAPPVVPAIPLGRTERVGTRVRTGWWEKIRPGKIGLLVASMYLFILAITLMKEGAGAFGPLVRNLLDVSARGQRLGFGWLFAYMIMSGSPVAAAALTFFRRRRGGQDGRLCHDHRQPAGRQALSCFYRVSLRAARPRPGNEPEHGPAVADRHRHDLSAGPLCWALFCYSLAPSMGCNCAPAPSSLGHRRGHRPIVGRGVRGCCRNGLCSWLGWASSWSVLACLTVPAPNGDKESQVGRMSRLVYRPWVMFALGALVTMVSMSVSLSLASWCLLSDRGFVRRENVIPYIMGANITTFVDTLLAAVLLNNPPAFTVVLVGMVSITLVSVVILATTYRGYEKSVLRFVGWATGSNRNLALFLATIFLVPVALMLV